MKILMVNKFLYPKGGSETYILKIGSYLKEQGHEVQYFGMEHKDRSVGNRVNAYTANMDFHGGSPWSKLAYPIQTIYSREARKKIRMVLEDMKPDVVHLNNINFQLTPSILYEISRSNTPMVQTVHDCQITCPSHRMYIEQSGRVCDECVASGNYMRCVTNRCIGNSLLKSAIAATESYYYHVRNTYNLVDAYICPSYYMSDILHKGGVQKKRIQVIHNPVDYSRDGLLSPEEPYVLYFGRFSAEKGLNTLLSVAQRLPDVKFVLAGSGPMADGWKLPANVQNVGFQSGESLKRWIEQAAFTVHPSECYENCPFTILESQALGTPVIGSRMGGIPELIEEGQTGLTFPAGNADALTQAISSLWEDQIKLEQMRNACLQNRPISMGIYTERLMNIYRDIGRRHAGASSF